MSWAVGFDSRWNRDIGYGVPSVCDHPGCGAEIDRGLSYVCGGEPYGGEFGCGLFFCAKHRFFAGDRRDNARLCTRCRYGKQPYKPTPDVATWVHHKLTDESWARWREECPAEVRSLRESLHVTT